MYGIPNMKLDKQEVLARRIDLMSQEGIRFICNADVGDNVEPQIFLKEFNATVLCTGATQPRDLPIEGRACRACISRSSISRPTPRPCWPASPTRARSMPATRMSSSSAAGDTGTDCVGSALRQGCKASCRSKFCPSRR